MANVQQRKVREAVADARASVLDSGKGRTTALQRRPGVLPGGGLPRGRPRPHPVVHGTLPGDTGPKP